jgi:hypothetical protein
VPGVEQIPQGLGQLSVRVPQAVVLIDQHGRCNALDDSEQGGCTDVGCCEGPSNKLTHHEQKSGLPAPFVGRDNRQNRCYRECVKNPGEQDPQNGRDLVLTVPVGTQVYDDDKETLLADLPRPGQRLVLLRGGDGGFGNSHFKTSTN